MYGSLTAADQLDTAPLVKTKSSRRNRFAGAAHAVRATQRLERSHRRRQKALKKKPEGVFGNIFPKEQTTTMTTTSSPTTKPLPLSMTKTTRHTHSFVYTLLNPRSRQWQALLFKRFLSIVIICDMLMFILSTEPSLKKSQRVFYVAEGTSSTIFLLEYVARLVTITECHKYKNNPITGRLRYMLTFSSIIDALATFPFFVEFVVGFGLPRLTYLRFFRLLRILRTTSFSKAADSCVRVIYYNREILHVAFVLCVYLVLFTAVLLYYLRPKHGHGEFKSIGSTMYMSTLMLTGQGGPEGDLPWYTKAIVLMTGVFSIGMFAIPASMLTWGFEAEAQRVAAKARRRRKHHKNANYDYSSTSSSSLDEDSESDVSTSDEEYLKIIAGDDEDDDDLLQGKSVEEQATLQELLDRFHKADVDESGNLTKREFLQIAEGLSFRNSLLQQQQLPVPSSSVLESRIEQLEKKVDATNSRLDRLLAMLEDARGGVTYA